MKTEKEFESTADRLILVLMHSGMAPADACVVLCIALGKVFGMTHKGHSFSEFWDGMHTGPVRKLLEQAYNSTNPN